MRAAGKARTGVVRSEFARALTRLLDETEYFSRSEWARFLGISTAALSQWVNDRTLPRADLLHLVVETLRRASGIPEGPLAEFDRLAALPATEVSPLGARMLPTVSAYIRKLSLADFGADLRMLPPEQQRRVLLDGSWDVGSSTEPGPRRPTPSEADFWVIKPHRSDTSNVDVRLLPRLQKANEQSKRIEHEALLSVPHVLIVGKAGTGKTCLLAGLHRAWVETKRISPVWLGPSARLNRGLNRSLKDLLNQEKREDCPILIDGFDELPAEVRSKAVKEVTELKKATKSPIVITSRPVPELSLLQGFEAFSVTPLTRRQIYLSLQRALDVGDNPTASEDLERFLCHLYERPALVQNCGNPLFLRTAWTLFKRNDVTPFAEVEVVGEFVRCLLDEWDREKNVVRAREPWASPQRLSGILGELCFQLTISKRDLFSTQEAEHWIGTKFSNVPCQRALSIISTLGWIAEQDGAKAWRITHDYFRRYFAALHVIESAGSAIEYLHSWRREPDLRSVLRMACGIASDATSILRTVLETTDADEADRCLLLAEIMAQPIVAAPEVVKASCEATIEWLSSAVKDWQIDCSSDDIKDENALWQLRLTGKSLENRRVWRALEAIHLARSGPAKGLLTKRMDGATGEVLPAFAGSMKVEGRLQLGQPHARENKLLAAVVSP